MDPLLKRTAVVLVGFDWWKAVISFVGLCVPWVPFKKKFPYPKSGSNFHPRHSFSYFYVDIPVIDWHSVQGVPRLSPKVRWDRLQPPWPSRGKVDIDNWWMISTIWPSPAMYSTTSSSCFLLTWVFWEWKPLLSWISYTFSECVYASHCSFLTCTDMNVFKIIQKRIESRHVSPCCCWRQSKST